MRLARMLSLAVAVLVPSISFAGAWTKWSGGPPAAPFVSGISSRDGTNVYTCGFEVALSGFTPVFHAHVWASTNGGHSFTELSGPFTSDNQAQPWAIDFIDDQRGWVGGFKKLWSTTDAGATWTTKTVDFDISAFHFFDAQRGVAAGYGGAIRLTSDGGATWTAVTSPTTADLFNMFWLDDQVGWITGYVETEDNSNPDQTVYVYSDAVVLSTTDGGHTWTSSAPVDNRGFESVFFLSDAKTGFLAAYERISGNQTTAYLYKSTDGGKTWTQMTFDSTVATLFNQPMPASFFRTMYWSDAQNGHLGGVVWTGDVSESSGGSSSTRPRYRIVDFVTHDGGANWERTNIGAVNVMDGSKGDGQMAAGLMRTLYGGWMVGEYQEVWGYVFTCAQNVDCGPSAVCNSSGTCDPSPSGCAPECANGETCHEHRCVAGSIGTDGGVPAGTDGGSSSGQNNNGSGSHSSGCGCASADGGLFAGAWVLLLLALPRMRRQFR